VLEEAIMSNQKKKSLFNGLLPQIKFKDSKTTNQTNEKNENNKRKKFNKDDYLKKQKIELERLINSFEFEFIEFASHNTTNKSILKNCFKPTNVGNFLLQPELSKLRNSFLNLSYGQKSYQNIYFIVKNVYANTGTKMTSYVNSRLPGFFNFKL
jgi:hypothetical protein